MLKDDKANLNVNNIHATSPLISVFTSAFIPVLLRFKGSLMGAILASPADTSDKNWGPHKSIRYNVYIKKKQKKKKKSIKANKVI